MEEMDSKKILSDIKALKIQGATNVALAVLDTLEANANLPAKELQHLGELLAYARPTEPLAQNAIRYIFSDTDKSLPSRITQYRTYIEEGKRSIPENGKQLLVSGGSYLTLCHSSTTVSLFKAARAGGAIFSMYVAETRPLFQGRITASELLKAGFDDVTMVIDDVAVSLIEGRIGKIDAVFIGADLLSDSGFVNKVGSLAVAAAATRHKIPIYCLTTLLKYDPRPYNPAVIEQRSAAEIWPDAPETLKFYAPAFDFVPYNEHIGIVTETGILPGDQLRSAVAAKYPFVLLGNTVA